MAVVTCPCDGNSDSRQRQDGKAAITTFSIDDAGITSTPNIKALVAAAGIVWPTLRGASLTTEIVAPNADAKANGDREFIEEHNRTSHGKPWHVRPYVGIYIGWVGDTLNFLLRNTLY